MGFTTIVLAGGKSLRMGKDKAFIEFEGQSLIQRTLDTLEPLFEKIAIISKIKEPFLSLGVPVYEDIYSEGGPMSGLYTGLFYSDGPIFAVACDMPFLNPEVVRFLTGKLQNFDAVVCQSPDGLHPLHAAYSKSVLPLMENSLNNGDVKMMKFLEKIKLLKIDCNQIRHLDPDIRFLSNINTPGDLKKCREMAKNSIL
ncbi:MAG: molybdenum cofactor guanylyltransferase [Nitrospiria bacterium]